MLLELAANEQRNMDVLDGLATQYAVEVSIYYWGCNILFWDYDEFDFYCHPTTAEVPWWGSWEGFAATAAYFEELSIRELKRAIDHTDEQSLVDAYAEMLRVV